MTQQGSGEEHAGTTDALSDAELILRTRSGNSGAFGELWSRHYRSGVTVARSITNSLDADDLVQEAYARIYQSILKGGGPTGSFRAYLFTSIRNTAASWGRARSETTIDQLEFVEDPETTEAATSEALDRSLTHQAFRSLPTRWQEVLWYSEIEGMRPAEIAPLLGLKATAVAQLTFRAREGLREAWIQAHLRSVADGSDCQWTIEHLGAFARNNLGIRDNKRVEGHLADCARCTIVAAEAKEVGSRLVLVLLPLTLGIAGGSAYLAALQGGSVALVAMAAMPSSVTPGAVVVGGGSAGTATAGAVSTGANTSASGAAGGGAAGASTTGAAASTGAGGALVGAGAAAASAGGIFAGAGLSIALAVGGVLATAAIVAAAVLPGILAPVVPPAEATVITPTSAPADQGTTADAADPAPTLPPAGPDPSDLPETAAPLPVAPPAQKRTTPAPAPTRPPAPPVVPTAPPVEPTTPLVEPTDPPVEPTDPPVEPTDPPVEPTDPPALPEGSPQITSYKWCWYLGTPVQITVILNGAPGATVDASIAGVSLRKVDLDDSGTASLMFSPSWTDLNANRSVDFTYTIDGEYGPSTSLTLDELTSGMLCAP